jgi:hypothetical protein
MSRRTLTAISRRLKRSRRFGVAEVAMAMGRIPNDAAVRDARTDAAA